MMENKKNIFDDLNKKGAGFSVPRSYLSDFDENFSKNRNRRSLGFKTPKSYFNNVENLVFEKLLESSNKKTGFSVPEGYFKDVANDFITYLFRYADRKLWNIRIGKSPERG